MTDKSMIYPSYLKACRDGRLEESIKKSWALLESCSLCPRRCGINRLNGKSGFCKTGSNPRVYSYYAHHGEEPPISGTKGSGTIFFSGCSMGCVYCQNYKFSQSEKGKYMDTETLSDTMLKLQDTGCHNINLVTPTHVLPQILKALSLAIPKGLIIPIVYNTGGYELPDTIKLLDGIVDIYLPDMRYADSAVAIKYSSAPDYPAYNQAAVLEMHRQAGIAEFNKEGIIKKGLIIRHLILPGGIAGTQKIMKFIAHNLSVDTYISLMSQYMPLYKAGRYKEISRRISREEYANAQAIMQDQGLYNGWSQESYGIEEMAGINIKPIP